MTTLKSYPEHQTQDQIREAALYIPGVNIFRANVGKGYLCHKKGKGYTTPRWFDTGLPVGFPDLFGYRTRIITPDMVGKTIAEFLYMEVKSEKGRVRPEQLELHRLFRQDGVPGGVVRSVDEAIIIMGGGIT